MAGFITARDGIHTVLQTITGATSGYFKVGYKYDRRYQTDATGEGYPYYTVSPSYDKNREAYRWTRSSEVIYDVVVRIFSLYDNTETNETAFLTLVDLALATLRANTNITLAGTVSDCLVTDVRTGYNDDAQPTMRVAEIHLDVRQRLSRV